MPGCDTCGEPAEFVFECPECGRRFCQAHLDPEAHACPETETANPTSSLRKTLPAFFLMVAVILVIVAALLLFSPDGPLGLDSGADAREPPSAGPSPDRAILQAVNDARDEANRSPVGDYGPLSDLAADRSWTPPPDGPFQVDASLTCRDIESVNYSADGPASEPDRVADAAVESWLADTDARVRILDTEADLAGAAYDPSGDRVWVRLVVCNSTG